MYSIVQFKNATWLIVIGIMTFAGSFVMATSPDETNVSAIGTDALATPRAAVADFNGDGHPDYVLHNAGTRQTAIWYLNNNIFLGGALGPTIVTGWFLKSATDFNLDSHPDYALFNPTTDQTAIWYVRTNIHWGALGPNLPTAGNW
jgi:hypothetical protein